MCLRYFHHDYCSSRWLRLLFGREFPLQDLLVLWDAIFSQEKDFKFVHYIVVAMLVAIRKQRKCTYMFYDFNSYNK